MNRKNKILKHIIKDGQGLEIGPCHKPIAPKRKGYNVHIIDHASREQLREKYKSHRVKIDNIEEVDFVWEGQSYLELTENPKYYDWIIASHMIEHTPDFIGFLNDCDSILKDGGVISLAVPDKRYCFDHYRPITGISQIIDSYFQKDTLHSPGTVAEYYLNVVSKSGNISWNSNSSGQYSFVHTLEEARSRMNLVNNESIYLDIHAWCFVPHSFRLIIHDLYSLGLIPFQEVEFFQTEGCEFYLTLSRDGKGIPKSRLEMLETIESEIKEQVAPPRTAKNMVINWLRRILKLLR